ncbi:MAG: class I SAM-dependent methyltransferase [Planctomycetota bacterium]|jgi:demethylmenaquinone methyltransferase/2-methoxy-6-polyprenyl-1,4-benzoquinol methylase
MALSKKEIRSSYETGAKYYDFAVRLYGLIGIRKAYRMRAVKLLRLKRGDCVVELGCGTGLNFPPIVKQIGAEGRLIGVDLSPKMLAHAQERVERAEWKNIELVQSDVVAYNFPEGVNGVLSTGVFGYLADYDRVIKAASHALVPGGRLAIMDGKRPERLPSWVFNLIVRLSRSFGVTSDYFDKRTWESVERYLRETVFEQMYGGMLYISSGTAA